MPGLNWQFPRSGEARTAPAFGRSFFVGLLILAVVSHIPFVGPPIAIVATLIGAGLVFEYGRGLVELRI